MSTQTLEDEVYHLYDTAVSKTLASFINNSPYCDGVYLRGFNRKNKEHLFILRMALMYRDLTQTPVEVGCSWWDSVVINWNIRKSFNKIKRLNPGTPGGYWVPELIDRIKFEIKDEYNKWLHLSYVYDTYYEGSCG